MVPLAGPVVHDAMLPKKGEPKLAAVLTDEGVLLDADNWRGKNQQWVYSPLSPSPSSLNKDATPQKKQT